MARVTAVPKDHPRIQSFSCGLILPCRHNPYQYLPQHILRPAMPTLSQYSPNPSPMVPEPAGLPPESAPVRPPPIPHQHSGSSSGFSPPSWASAQYQSMNAFPQGYPPSTPYHPAQQAFTPYHQPGSYHPPPVGLPSGVPPTPDARILPNGLSADWIGSASGWNPNMPPVTPYNGPQPHTGFSAFHQPLPGGGPPPEFAPNGWGGGPPPAAYSAPWNAPATPAGPPGWGGGGGGGGWGGWGPQMAPTTPWSSGGGGGGGPHPWAQPPAPIVPQHTGGGPAAAMRDRSNEGLDMVDLFATGPHCRRFSLVVAGRTLIAFHRWARPHPTPSPHCWGPAEGQPPPDRPNPGPRPSLP